MTSITCSVHVSSVLVLTEDTVINVRFELVVTVLSVIETMSVGYVKSSFTPYMLRCGAVPLCVAAPHHTSTHPP